MFISCRCCLTFAFVTNGLEKASSSSSETCTLPWHFPNTDQNHTLNFPLLDHVLNFPLLDCTICEILFVVMLLFKNNQTKKTPTTPTKQIPTKQNPKLTKQMEKNLENNSFSLTSYSYQLQIFPDVLRFPYNASKLHLYFFIYSSLPFSKYFWVWVVGLLIYFHFRFPLLIHSWTEIRFYSKLIIWIGKSCLAWIIISLATWPVLQKNHDLSHNTVCK